ncbi:MAG: hypothetical protein E6G66_04075 [Actinobacteria bacterium]|nr:MAG: hypothetical protein E6G66_04075 [Actinomycetota bacterium]
MNLAGKLQIKPGSKVLVLGAPDGYLASLEPLPAGAEVAEEPGDFFDVVQAFVRDRADLARPSRRSVPSSPRAWMPW